MPDLITPAKTMIVARLQRDIEDATIYDNVPVGAKLPLVALASFEAENVGPKDSVLLRATLTVDVIMMGSRKDPWREMCGRVEAALHDYRPSAPGVLASTMQYESTSEQVIEDEAGTGFAGTMTFEVYLQAE